MASLGIARGCGVAAWRIQREVHRAWNSAAQRSVNGKHTAPVLSFGGV